MSKEEIEIKIWEIKNKIDDIREYISSDFCTNCIDMYRQRQLCENQLKELEDQLNNEHQS
jgi:hypothetical protein